MWRARFVRGGWAGYLEVLWGFEFLNKFVIEEKRDLGIVVK